MPPRKGEAGENSWYRIVNAAADGPTQIQIYDEIGYFGCTAQDFLRDLAAIDGPVEVHVNSPGGEVFDAYAIYNALAGRPGVTTVVDGVAASAASFIVMAGEQRLMARTSQMMIHDGWSQAAGNAQELQHMSARLETVSAQIAGIYADTAGGEPTYWRGLMQDETWFTPQQALDAGLITGIVAGGRAPAATAAAHAAVAGAINAAMTPAPWDPDGDGDDDSTPEGDTDHSHWSADGKQLKSVPGKPMPGQAPVDSATGPVTNADTSAWDASRAWANGAASDDPAAFYAGICAGRKAGDKSTQAAWALPYRYHPGDAPNEAGVRNALARLPQTQGLTNEAEARATLEAAMKKINPDYEPSQSRSRVPNPGNEGNGTMPEHQDALTIEARRSEIGDINARVQEIAAQHPASVLPADVQAEWDQLVATRRDHQAALDAVEARNAVLAEMHAGNLDNRDRPQGSANTSPAVIDRPRPGAPAVHLTGDIYDLAAIRQQARSHEELPELYRANALRAIDAARFPGSNREDAQQHVAGLLDTIPDDATGELARRILATGSPGYKRAFGRALAAGNPGALGGQDARVLALGESDTGSYAVPFELDPTVILTSAGTANPLRRISRVQQIVGKEYDLVTSAGVTVSRKAEFSATTDNSPTLVQPTIKAQRVDGFIPFSVEIEGDWAGLQASMMELLRDAKDIEEATSFTLGDGTPPDAGGVITTMASGSNVAGATAALAITDPQKLENALPPRFRGNASFMASKTTYNAYRTLFAGQAGYATDPWNRPSQGQPAQLFGYNAEEASDMVATHATGDKPLILGDFKRGFLIVDRVGMNMELVPHLFGSAQGQYPTGRRGYFAWWRNNSVVLVPNAFRLLVLA